MFTILRNNAFKSISFRSTQLNSPSNGLVTVTANQHLTSSSSQSHHSNNDEQRRSLLSISSDSSSNMLPINKLAHDITKKRYSTQQHTAEEIAKIRETYKKFEELGKNFEIPVPWGKLACKEFGKKSNNGRQILMVHGWLDNLNTWSLMVPQLLERLEQLDKEPHIVLFDEPGCGFSDGKPRGTYYEVLGTIVEMRRVIKHMGWDKVTLIGHSKGSFNCFIYAALFPSEVERLISCDLVGPDVNFDSDIADHIDKRIEMDKIFIKDKEGLTFTKEYTEQSALERPLKSRPIFNLSPIHGELLLKRGLKPFKDAFTFTRDIQWNSFSIALYPSRETMLNYLEPLEADILNFVAKDSPFRVDPSYWDSYRELYRRQCKVYEEKLIDGSHYIHMSHPQLLADEIIKFINKSTEIRLGNKL